MKIEKNIEIPGVKSFESRKHKSFDKERTIFPWKSTIRDSNWKCPRKKRSSKFYVPTETVCHEFLFFSPARKVALSRRVRGQKVSAIDNGRTVMHGSLTSGGATGSIWFMRWQRNTNDKTERNTLRGYCRRVMELHCDRDVCVLPIVSER